MPTESNRSSERVNLTTAEQTQSKNDWEADEEEEGDDEAGFGDDFDDFEEGAEAGEDDFGDFDDGFTAAAGVPDASTGPDPTFQPSLPASDSAIVSSSLKSYSSNALLHRDELRCILPGQTCLNRNVCHANALLTAYP